MIIYVGTMNTCHFDDAKLALDAGKHCLLEKVRFGLESTDEQPATLNAAEWKVLAGLAKEKNVFLMEGKST
jgi:dihydrodiol dehydrogenase / D-xylose 1-dehydrogenase (NADP)